MGEEPSIKVQFLRQTNLAEAIRLEESERWNQTEAGLEAHSETLSARMFRRILPRIACRYSHDN